ncbi:MAG: hypothetical protein LUH47_04255 [Clostridiales bacterium]|nr:hypothetical protein [Clostridiales bacterium]
MKLKTILGFALGITTGLFMAISAYGATSISVGDVTTSSDGYVIVPVYFNSTSYTGINAYDVEVVFDGNKIDGDAFVYEDNYDTVDELYVSSGRVTSNPGKLTTSGPFTDKTSGWQYCKANYFYDYEFDVDENGQLLLFSMYLKPADGYSASDFTSKDFSVKIVELVASEEIEAEAGVIKDDFATYVIYNVPKEVPEDWEYGYITGLTAKITDSESGDVLKEAALDSYVETDDNYSFIVNLTETTKGYTEQLKSVVDVEFIATVTDSEEGTITTDISVNALEDVEVEYFDYLD